MDSPKKILIIQTAFPGDVVLTLPLLQICKKHFPDAAIDFLVIPSTSVLLKNNPYVNEVINYDKRRKEIRTFLELTKRLKKKKYDIVISPHRSHRSAMISYMSKPLKSISFNISSLSQLYDVTVSYEPRLHEIQRNLKLLEPLGILEKEIIKPELFIGEEEKNKIDDFFAVSGVSGSDKIISFAPGSVWFTKRYPKEKFVMISDEFKNQNIKIIMIGGPDESDLLDYICRNTQNRNVINTHGRFSLLESAEIIRRSEVLLTNDSAPLHIGNAVSTKVVAIFGSTIPAFGFYPYGSRDVIVEVNGLKCRPCGIHGRKKCPVGTLECMTSIDKGKIVDLLQ